MVIVINSKGGLVSQQVEDLFQGSSKANIINVIAPFSSNIVFRANFEMPDGTILPEDQGGYIFKPSIKVVDGLNMWKLPIEFPITQNYGVVSMQLRAMIEEEILCTTTVKFPIQKGVPYDSEYVEQGTYDAILQMIADVRALLNNKVDIKNYNYKVAENIDKDTIGAYYIYDNENDIYKAVLLPENYKEKETYYKIETDGTIINRKDGIYISFQKDGKKSEIAVKENAVYINNKQVVVFDDLVAENIVYDNTSGQLKAEDVKSALDELSNDFKNVKNSQVFDLGVHTILGASWVEENGVYKYKFSHEYLTDEKTQSIIITPNDEAIDNLNNNDILIYPQIDIVKVDNTVYAVVSADKKPNFDIVAEFKLQGVSATNETPNITASYVSFNAIDKVNANNVQNAIIEVQKNINNNQNAVENYINENAEKLEFVENEIKKQENLIGFPYNNSETHNGFTATTKDNLITINGTAGDFSAEIPLKYMPSALKLKAGTYCLKAYFVSEYDLGTMGNNIAIKLNNNSYAMSALTYGQVITFNEDTEITSIGVHVEKWLGSANNIKFKLKLEKGNIPSDYTDFVGEFLYKGDEIAVFAESEMLKTKNLLGASRYTTRTINGITFTLNEDGSISAKGTASYNAIFDMDAVYLSAGTYFVSVRNKNGEINTKAHLQLHYPGVYNNVENKSFILNETKNCDFEFYIETGTSVDETFYIQVENGENPTDYEKYNGAIVHEKDIQKSDFTAELLASFKPTINTYSKIPFDSLVSAGGDRITLDTATGEIKINDETIRKLKISWNFTVYGTYTADFYTRIVRSTSGAMEPIAINNVLVNNNYSFGCSPRIIAVKSGESVYLELQTNNDDVQLSGVRSYMTVEVVD